MHSRLFIFFFLLLVVACNSDQTEIKYRMLNWVDLKSSHADFDDPFEELNPDQFFDLSLIYRYRDQLRQNPDTITHESKEEIDLLVEELTSQGVQVDSLIALNFIISEKRDKRSEATVESLNDVYIRMPGYLLPLDYQNEVSTEFLLVPWVGACIHTPPPPKNQIVFLKYPEGFKQVSEFQPVWVEGLMTTKEEVKELYYVDGSDDISTGYTMLVNKIFDFGAISRKN